MTKWETKKKNEYKANDFECHIHTCDANPMCSSMIIAHCSALHAMVVDADANDDNDVDNIGILSMKNYCYDYSMPLEKRIRVNTCSGVY